MSIKNIGSVVVTFNPEMNKLDELIKKLSKWLPYVQIVDNGSDNIEEINSIISQNVYLIKLQQNRGIAYALNIGISELNGKGMEWAVTFDQDSLPTDDYFLNFDDFKKPSNTGLVGGYYIDRNWSSDERKKYVNKFSEIDATFYVITSGAFVNISAWNSVLGFDDQLFIDWVDWDFNKRLIAANYGVYRTNHLLIKHEVGEIIHRNIFLRTLLFINNRPIRDHSAFRQYYIFRNRIIFIKRYNSKKNNLYCFLKSAIALREVLLLPKAGSKLKSSIRGIRDGLNYSVKNDDFFNKSIGMK